MFWFIKLVELFLYLLMALLAGFIVVVGKTGSNIKGHFFLVALILLGTMIWL